MAEIRFIDGYSNDKNELISFVDSNAQRKLEILRNMVKDIVNKISDLSSADELKSLSDQVKKASEELEKYKSELELIKESLKDVDEETDDFGSDLAMLATLPKQNKSAIEATKIKIDSLVSRVDILEEQVQSIDLVSLESRVEAIEELNLTKEKVKTLEMLIEAAGLTVDNSTGENKYTMDIKYVQDKDAALK